jgi:hypothetical protein
MHDYPHHGKYHLLLIETRCGAKELKEKENDQQ